MLNKNGLKTFPFYHQSYPKDCGPTCIRMVAEFYGKTFNPYQIKHFSKIHRKGMSLMGISKEAEKIGFKTMALEVRLEFLNEIDLPVILHWNQNHFVVLVEIKDNNYHVADPALGILSLGKSEFLSSWQNTAHNRDSEGIVLTFQLQQIFTSNHFG